jgi:hypothetical protein
MANLPKVLIVAACALALGGCARNYVREEPHHFSKDARGNRIACYTTDVANEFECVPVYRDYGYAGYRGYHDPFWSPGYLYGWPYQHHHVVVVDEPAPNPPPPPVHWRPRAKRK